MIKPSEHLMFDATEIIREAAITFESISTKVLKESTIGSGDAAFPMVTIEVVLQTLGVKNWNGRIYPAQLIMDAIENDPHIQADMSKGAWVGENGHPHSNEPKRLLTLDPNTASHRILKVWREGINLKAIVQTLPTAAGIEMARCVQCGIPVAFSLRALGKTDANGVAVAPIKVITYDRVWRPSHKDAYIEKVLTEGATGIDVQAFEYDIEDVIRECVDTVALTESVSVDTIDTYRKSNDPFEAISDMMGLDDVQMVMNEAATGFIAKGKDKDIFIPASRVMDMEMTDILLGVRKE